MFVCKWNESGFRPPLCTYRLNWARRTSWGWWDDWDHTVLQTQDSKFEPWRSEAEHATSRSRRLPTILTFTRGWVCLYALTKENMQSATEGIQKGGTKLPGEHEIISEDVKNVPERKGVPTPHPPPINNVTPNAQLKERIIGKYYCRPTETIINTILL